MNSGTNPGRNARGWIRRRPCTPRGVSCCPRGFRECEAAGARFAARPRDPQARAHCALRAPLRARGDTTAALRHEASFASSLVIGSLVTDNRASCFRVSNSLVSSCSLRACRDCFTRMTASASLLGPSTSAGLRCAANKSRHALSRLHG